MDMSPISLRNQCIDCLAKNTNILWDAWSPHVGYITLFEWNDPELFLHSDLADRLLEALSRNHMLTNELMRTFTPDRVNLQRVKIAGDSTISEKGLKVLKGHSGLTSLEICLSKDLNLRTEAVIECMENSRNTLQHLRCNFDTVSLWHRSFADAALALDRYRPREAEPQPGSVPRSWAATLLYSMTNLRSVDFSCSKFFFDRDLADLCRNLRCVESLNISYNEDIGDISPLISCRETLKSLSMYTMGRLERDCTRYTLRALTQLTYLDVSMKSRSWITSRSPRWRNRHIRRVLTTTALLEGPFLAPNLEFLDLSGRGTAQDSVISTFLDAHPSLRFLGLWDSDACNSKQLQKYTPRLTVTGNATLDQYVAALRQFSTHEDRTKVILKTLVDDLDKKKFAPAHDGGQIIQALLDVIPTSSTSCFSEQRPVWKIVPDCLRCIFALLQQGIVCHMQPGTRLHLRNVCLRTLGQKWNISRQNKYKETALKILRFLDEDYLE